MTDLFLLHPEVAGGLGPRTVLKSRGANPPLVTTLDYQFDGWLGDELLTTFPCFIVSDALAQNLGHAGLTGFVTEDMLVSLSDEFALRAPPLPKFHRLIPLGAIVVLGDAATDWSGHDLCLSENGGLVVTERCLDVLMEHSLANCGVNPLHVVVARNSNGTEADEE